MISFLKCPFVPTFLLIIARSCDQKNGNVFSQGPILSLCLSSLFSFSAFNLSSSTSFSFCFRSTLLKNQVTSLNKLSRKLFASSHYKLHIMGYGITYLTCNSASLLLLPSSLLLRLLSLKFQEIVSVKHSFTMQVYCENGFTFQIQLENEVRTLT